MYKFVLSIASLAALASAYTTPTAQCTDGCNPIAKPGLNEVVVAGAPYTITWAPTTSGTVTVVLMKGPSENILPLYPIAEKIPNTGSLPWTPALDLVPTGNAGYGLQLINDADGTYQWSTQFGISNSGYAVSSSAAAVSSAPASSSPAVSSSAYVISSTPVHNGTVSSAPSNGTISSAPASSSAAPTGYSNSTTAMVSSSAAASSSLRTTTTTSRASSSSTALPSSGAAVIGASVVGGFAAVVAAVFAL